jgi:hypothetical protein
MNARIAAILVALLVILGAGALVYQRFDRAASPTNASALGQPVLKQFKAADVATIAIVEPGGKLTLEKKGERWTIKERADYPASFEKVREFVLKLIELKVGQSDAISEADRARLRLLEPAADGEAKAKEGAGTQVELRAGDGKSLARLIVGRKYFKSTPEDPEKAAGDGRFVLVPERATTVYVVGDTLAQATAKSASWVSSAGIGPEKVKTLELRNPDGSGWRVSRSGDNNDWRLDGLAAGEKLDFTKPNSASYSLGRLSIADVAPPGTKPEEVGLDKPTLISLTTLDGLAYTVRLGKEQGPNRYAKLEVSGTPLKARAPEKGETAEDKARRDKDFEERLKKIDERFAAEKRLADYIVLVPKSSLDQDVLKKRAELLEPKGR